MRTLKPLALFSLVLVLPACGPSRKSVYPVKGRVVDSAGNPLVGATVIFHPVAPDPEDPTKPAAHVDEKGTFELTTYVEGDGAPAGEYAVTILLVPPKKGPLDTQAPDRLKGKYANPKDSKIRVTVEKKELNEVPEIRLEVPQAKPKATTRP
jgi:hypothetical protein